MTDRRNNSNEMSDEDWAMSETEPELKGKELEITSPPEDINENVSSLYDPLETDELKGWDISEEDSALSDIAELPDTAELPAEPTPDFSETAEDQTPIEADQTPHVFRSSTNSIEIIEPEKPTINGESWEMKKAPPQDGWKMPEPEFRHSEGKPLQKENQEMSAHDDATANPQEQQEVEALSEIYAPPGTETSGAEFSEPVESEFSEEEEEFFETEDFEDLPEEQIELEENPQEAAPKKSTGKFLIFVLLGLLGISVLLLVILGAAYIYYSGFSGTGLDVR